ncbi:MAG TPA: hypothetical protein VIG74_06640 [Alphaproteobacteria bacterium]|jgi:hypothetical protein
MTKYVLTVLSKTFADAAAEAQCFEDIQKDVESSESLSLASAQPFIGTMIIEAEKEDALKSLQEKYKDHIDLQPQRIFRRIIE